MAAQMTIDLSELESWSDQVERASQDLRRISQNADSNLAQKDFGPILEVMMGSYHSLLGNVNTTLQQDAGRVADHANALKATVQDFKLTESSVTSQYRGAWATGADNSSASFHDVVDTTVPTAYATESELPKVSFGFPYDTVCDLIAAFTGFDIRRELSEKIGGDIVGASRQGSSMGAIGRAVSSVATNVETGSQTIGQSWEGGASEAALTQIAAWVGELNSQAGRLMQMGINMLQVCRTAWQVAQSVVECIKSAVQTVSSALATLSIPGVGWARVVQAIFQAFQAVIKAFRVIKQFIGLLQQLGEYIKLVKTFFDTGKLPESTPTPPTGAGTAAQVVNDPDSVRTPVFGGYGMATA